MSNLLNEKFSTRAKNALKTAQTISRHMQHRYIGTEHLLYGIVSEISSFASEVLLKNRITAEAIKLELAKNTFLSGTEKWEPILSENLRLALEKAAAAAGKYEYQFIGTEHFLFGIVDQNSNRAQQILANLNISVADIRKNLLSIFENTARFPQITPTVRDQPKDFEDGEADSGALEYFTTDLTERAKKGQIDPLVGREKEIERLISILSRRTKNNPVLIGEPGVGKTAIVEGLALAIHQQRVPDSLLSKRVLALDLALIVAGSMFRGEFENRMKQIIDEVQSAGDIILFIDELHTVVGAGSATGSLDAANILKPALARGELRAIGATTLAEYKKHIEPDAALERRFQPILVSEPTPAETIAILHGLRPYYEKHHEVVILDEALSAAVKLSVRYLTDRFLPDKAIDLLDETAAFHKMRQQSKVQTVSLKKIEREISELVSQKKEAVFNQDFEQAEKIKIEEERLRRVQKKIQNQEPDRKNWIEISAYQIAQTLSRVTGIQLDTILRKEKSRVLNLEAAMKKSIVGQDKVLRELAVAVIRSRAGINSPGRPLASFMFLGPTGVGKTLVAKTLARELFEDENALIRIDMSELMEKHNVARLIGAPAGYIGYEQGGRLTEAIKRKPYAVVLFDEIEKAHPDIYNLLLQILEDGQLTDAAGHMINFRNTIVILTSNIGGNYLKEWASAIGFTAEASKKEAVASEWRQQVEKQIRLHFRPEFLNRLDKILIFEPLTRQALEEIVKIEIRQLQHKLSDQQIKLAASKAVIDYLTAISLDPQQGARQVRKNLQNFLEDPIAQMLVAGRAGAGSLLSVKLKKSGENKIIDFETQKT